MSKTTTEMQLVPIAKLVPYVNNARTHSPEQINKLRSSLREFGFINPVIIDADYNVIAGHGRLMAAKEEGIEIRNLAPNFVNRISQPYFVKYEYREELLDQPIHTTKHSGQEFDLVLSGSMKVQVGDHIEVLHEGDSIYYNSSLPHGMIAVEGKDCVFCAIILPGEEPAAEAPAAVGSSWEDNPTYARLKELGIYDREPITLNVYSQLANYSGVQGHWSADLLLDMFNVKINIIPESDGTYATRMESKNLV